MSLGTPHYMSPEQAFGEENVDARSDQHALACLVYEMLAGAPPFGPRAPRGRGAHTLTARWATFLLRERVDVAH